MVDLSPFSGSGKFQIQYRATRRSRLMACPCFREFLIDRVRGAMDGHLTGRLYLYTNPALWLRALSRIPPSENIHVVLQQHRTVFSCQSELPSELRVRAVSSEQASLA